MTPLEKLIEKYGPDNVKKALEEYKKIAGAGNSQSSNGGK